MLLWSSVSQEPFEAVGQWRSVVVVSLVRIARRGAKIAVVEEQRLEDDWDWRSGYAS